LAQLQLVGSLAWTPPWTASKCVCTRGGNIMAALLVAAALLKPFALRWIFRVRPGLDCRQGSLPS